MVKYTEGLLSPGQNGFELSDVHDPLAQHKRREQPFVCVYRAKLDGRRSEGLTLGGTITIAGCRC